MMKKIIDTILIFTHDSINQEIKDAEYWENQYSANPENPECKTFAIEHRAKSRALIDIHVLISDITKRYET